MAIYELKGFHHRKAIVKGDVEAETVLVVSESFSTRKAANFELKNYEKTLRNRGYKVSAIYAERGDKGSSVLAFTGNTWIHENTGEEHEECYVYEVIKKK